MYSVDLIKQKSIGFVFKLSLQMSGVLILITFDLQNVINKMVFCLCIFLIDLFLVILTGQAIVKYTYIYVCIYIA